MKLVKTSFFSAIITFVRISSGFISGKIIALITGPAGVALLGSFTNFITIILTFANGAINTGVIKYTAEHGSDDIKIKALFSTSLKISFFCSVIVGFFLVLFSSFFSSLVFSDTLYTKEICVLGFTIIFYSLNTLMISVLNGKGQIKKFTLVNLIGTLVGLLATILLVYFFNLKGAIYALILTPSLVFFITVILLYRTPWFSWSYFGGKLDIKIAKNLGAYSLMAIVSALTIPVSQILIRNMLISKVGINDAGYWQAMLRVSDGYLMLITTSLGTYYLPKLSAITSDSAIKKEVSYGYKIVMPVVLIGCVSIYFLRFFIIELLFSPKFSQMEGLFFWQLIGDLFKVATFLLGYVMVAKAMTTYYIMTEIIFSSLYVFFSWVFVSKFGLIGVTEAFALNYLICFIYMLFIFRKLVFKKISYESIS
jgi:O-antigen/teichoic acid export membrane protein